MNWLIVPISAIFYRLDGWGKRDSFLPFKPFTIDSWKIGGINYARYAIGAIIALITMNWVYILTYSIAVSIPYGEKSITERIFKNYKWFIIGLAFGAASLSMANAIWCGIMFTVLKLYDTDQAWMEFLFGALGTLIYVFR